MKYSEFKLKFLIFRKQVINTLDKLFPSSAIPDVKSPLGPQKMEKAEKIQKGKTLSIALFASLVIQPAGWLLLGQQGLNITSGFLVVWGSSGIIVLFLMQKVESKEKDKEISKLKQTTEELRFEIDRIKKHLALP